MSSSRPFWPTQQDLVTSQFKVPMTFRWQLLKCTNHPSFMGHNKTGGEPGLATPALLRFLTYHSLLPTLQNHGFPFPLILITISSFLIRANVAQRIMINERTEQHRDGKQALYQIQEPGKESV